METEIHELNHDVYPPLVSSLSPHFTNLQNYKDLYNESINNPDTFWEKVKTLIESNQTNFQSDHS